MNLVAPHVPPGGRTGGETPPAPAAGDGRANLAPEFVEFGWTATLPASAHPRHGQAEWLAEFACFPGDMVTPTAQCCAGPRACQSSTNLRASRLKR